MVGVRKFCLELVKLRESRAKQEFGPPRTIVGCYSTFQAFAFGVGAFKVDFVQKGIFFIPFFHQGEERGMIKMRHLIFVGLIIR